MLGPEKGRNPSPGGAEHSFPVVLETESGIVQALALTLRFSGCAAQKPSMITFNVGAPTFLPVILAEPWPIPAEQLAPAPDLIRNQSA
jgi:hypothetical protein